MQLGFCTSAARRLRRALGGHATRLREAFGIAGVAGKIAEATLVVSLDYLMWVCAVYTWANTSPLAEEWLGAEGLSLAGARRAAVWVCLWWWSVRLSVWLGGWRSALPPCVSDLLRTRSTDMEITLDGVVSSVEV